MRDKPFIWKIAIYVRVSTDKKNQQESIPDQIESLKRWIREKNSIEVDNIYKLVGIYEDTGCSGTNFDRDGFIKMKKDIDFGIVNMVLTRDLSRFSRNYVSAGYYMEDYFKIKGVRFVSVLDNADTFKEIDDIIPFKNILNEMYVKDCSKRTKEGLRQRMLRGSCISSKPPYGYGYEVEFDGRLKNIRLVPLEDESAMVVRKIFALYIDGWGMNKIANHLNSMGIAPPSARLRFPRAKLGIWSTGGIRYILTNPKYGGYMAQHRWEKMSYKNKKVKSVLKEDWIYGNDFEGIISKEQYDLVQNLIAARGSKSRNKGEIHIFSSVLVCGDCGGGMIYRKNFKGYKCGNSQKGGSKCTAHSIKEQELIEVIKAEIKELVFKSVDKEKLMVLIEQWFLKKDSYNNQILNIEYELDRLDKEFREIYRDKLNRIVNERNFNYLVRDIETRQEKLLEKKREIIKLRDYMEDKEKQKQCYELLSSIIKLESIDKSVIECLVSNIVIKEGNNLEKKTVCINYKFKNSAEKN